MSKRLQKVPPKYRKQVKNRLKEVAKKIQLRRESLDISQEKLAEKLNISHSSMQYIEQGRRIPSLENLFYICSYLQIDISIK